MAVTVKLEAPAVVGVPEIAPALLRVNPAGRVPVVTLQAAVPTPPVDCNAALYAVPTTPLGTDAVVMASKALIVMLKDWVAVSWGELESVAVTLKVEVPAVVGEPEIMPELPKFNPPGKVPVVKLQVIAPLPPTDATGAL